MTDGSGIVPDLRQEFEEELGALDAGALRNRLSGYLETWVGRQEPETGFCHASGYEPEFERLIAEHETLAVIYIAVDFLPLVIESLGRETGAGILAALANFIRAAAHEQDACFHDPEEEAEFLVLSPDLDPGGAFRLAERIRNNVTARSYGFFGLPVTASLGVAVYPLHATRLDSLLQLARSSGRLAELLGRDRTVVYEPDHSATARLSQSPDGTRLHNLPVPSSPFVGRNRELSEIESRLLDPACRLLTLTGPGGIGKTRLALEVAARLMPRLSFGVFTVSLDTMPSPYLLPNLLADSLGFSFAGPEDHLGQITGFLQDKEALLLMDSFEAILPATGILSGILAAAPLVKVLATSQVRLNLGEEWVMEVEGMACPPEEEGEKASLEEYDAVRLFLQGARRVDPAFTLVPEDRRWMVRICRRVEGSPLAIELASSWARALPLSDIAREMEKDLDFLATNRADVPERHRGLRIVFEHSWEVLEPDEAACFSALSVFQGGFRREAAKAVAGATLIRLAALVDKSLVRRNPNGRYEAHGLLRKYAEEKLEEDAAAREQAHDAHCAFFAAFLEERESRLEGMLQKETLQEIGEEIENIRAAWDHAVQKCLYVEMGKSLGSLCVFYDIRGWLEEGATVLERATEELRRKEGEVFQEEGAEEHCRMLLGRVLARRGRFFRRRGDYRQAGDLLEEALGIFRELGEEKEEALSLLWLGNVKESRGEYRRAEEDYGMALHIFRVAGDRGGMADALKDLGNVSHSQGEYSAARDYYEECLDLYQDEGDLRGISAALNNLGVVAEFLGENMEAMRLYQESLAIDREIGEQMGIATSLINLGDIACVMGKLAEARRYLTEALKISHRAIALPVVVEVLGGMARLLAWEGKREEAMELASLVYAHPACGREDRDRAAGLIARMEAELPEPVAREAGQRGRSLLLADTAAGILAASS